MKRLLAFVPALVLVLWVSLAHSISYVGVQAGGTGSATPIPVGTSTPVKVIACGSGANYIKFNVVGGTVGTDGCYITVSTTYASPCAAATPAPNASTQVGDFAPTGGTNPSASPLMYNYANQVGSYWMNGEWDAVCTAASMTVTPVTLP
jgi:hypothetical protein